MRLSMAAAESGTVRRWPTAPTAPAPALTGPYTTDLRPIVVSLAKHTLARTVVGAIATAGMAVSLIWRRSRVALVVGIFSACLSGVMTVGSYNDALLFHEEAVRAELSLASGK